MKPARKERPGRRSRADRYTETPNPTVTDKYGNEYPAKLVEQAVPVFTDIVGRQMNGTIVAVKEGEPLEKGVVSVAMNRAFKRRQGWGRVTKRLASRPANHWLRGRLTAASARAEIEALTATSDHEARAKRTEDGKLGTAARAEGYRRQTGNVLLTPAQRRRLAKKDRRP